MAINACATAFKSPRPLVNKRLVWELRAKHFIYVKNNYTN